MASDCWVDIGAVWICGGYFGFEDSRELQTPISSGGTCANIYSLVVGRFSKLIYLFSLVSRKVNIAITKVQGVSSRYLAFWSNE